MSELVMGIVVEAKTQEPPRLRVSSFDIDRLVALTMALPSAEPGAAQAQLVPLTPGDKGDGIIAVGSAISEGGDGVLWLWDARIVQILPPAEALRTWAALQVAGRAPHLPDVGLTSR